jgi:hypothetical protein
MAKRISVRIEPDEEKIIRWVIESTGSTQTDAVRLMIDLVGSSFNAQMLQQHYVHLRNRDRARPAKSR